MHFTTIYFQLNQVATCVFKLCLLHFFVKLVIKNLMAVNRITLMLCLKPHLQCRDQALGPIGLETVIEYLLCKYHHINMNTEPGK